MQVPSRKVLGLAVLAASLLLTLAGRPTAAFQQNIIVWDERRPLAWADFRGAPDDNNGAITIVYTGFTPTAWECRRDGKVKIVEGGMLAHMEPEKSWAKPRGRGNADILKHEQGHFDITEVFARRLRMFIRSVECSARPGEAVVRDVTRGFTQLHTEWQSTQATYDRDTNHHENVQKQREWNERLRRLLDDTKGQ